LYGTIPYKSPIGQLERQIKWRIQENGHYRNDKMVATYSRGMDNCLLQVDDGQGIIM
jgi:hypothetical protein